MTSVSAGHIMIMLTPTQSVRSGWPQRESNPESRDLPTELPRPPKENTKKALDRIDTRLGRLAENNSYNKTTTQRKQQKKAE